MSTRQSSYFHPIVAVIYGALTSYVQFSQQVVTLETKNSELKQNLDQVQDLRLLLVCPVPYNVQFSHAVCDTISCAVYHDRCAMCGVRYAMILYLILNLNRAEPRLRLPTWNWTSTYR